MLLSIKSVCSARIAIYLSPMLQMYPRSIGSLSYTSLYCFNNCSANNESLKSLIILINTLRIFPSFCSIKNKIVSLCSCFSFLLCAYHEPYNLKPPLLPLALSIGTPSTFLKYLISFPTMA